MEDLIFLILVFLSLINSKIKCGNKFFNDYMEIENTNNVKGIFVWMIFFRHFTGYYMRNPRKVSIIIDSSFDQNIVSLFLFYSGYGIYKSFLKKGIKYIKTLPIKSIILFIKTQLILLMFLLNNIILHNKISLKEYFYAVILKKSIGNSYWFSFTIIIVYIEAFFAFILITNKKYTFLGIIFLTIICFFHIKFVYKYYHQNVIISVDTIICFITGFYYCYFQLYIDEIVMHNDINYFSLLSIIIYLYYKFYIHDKKAILLYKILKNFFFTLILVILTMKIQLKNDFLKFLNSHSYSIYLLQRIVFIYILQKGILKSYPFIRFFFDFSIIILMSCLFDKYSIYIDIFLKNYFKISQNNRDNKKLVDN
jgi:peptidoglycan/LPS O-acetylase OafA/YrhL